jgi:hypothetical protein
MIGSRIRRYGWVAVCAVTLVTMAPSVARAEGPPSPGWAIRSVATPSNFSSSDNARCESEEVCDEYQVTAENVGTRPSEGAVRIHDVLPAGITVGSVAGSEEIRLDHGQLIRSPIECQASPGSSEFECAALEPVPAGGIIVFNVRLQVAVGSPRSVVNFAEIGGGGALPASTRNPATTGNTVEGGRAPFGVQDFSVGAFGVDGTPDVQAGAHPSTVVSTIDFTTVHETVGERALNLEETRPMEDPKTVLVHLPRGFIGNPQAAGQCAQTSLLGSERHPENCPADSQVGTVELVLPGGGFARLLPLYNLVPDPGYPVEFGTEFDSATILLRAQVLPSEEGYAVSIAVIGIPRSTILKLLGVTITFFGDPVESDHVSGVPSAFLTNPSECSTPPQPVRLEMDSWVNPSRWVSAETPMFALPHGVGLEGCDLLKFDPSIALVPESSAPDSPSGYEVGVTVPQAPGAVSTLATPDVEKASVSLPAGVVLSPATAAGLTGCNEHGPGGFQPGDKNTVGHDVQEGEELQGDGLVHPARGECPSSSRVGDVEVSTPLLPEPLHGHLYVAQPRCGGVLPACTAASATNGELFSVYLEAQGSGVVIKQKGVVSADPVSGRVSTSFEGIPEFPFESLKVSLYGGSRAALANPQTCTAGEATSVLLPWSSTTAATPFAPISFASCSLPMGFAPSLNAGTRSSRAAATDSFALAVSRADGEQNFAGMSVSMPPGLIALVSHVTPCGEPAAAQGTCGPESLIGHTQVAAGSGSSPLWVSGRVYLTTAYGGGSFGLSIVTPAVAGPFDLGLVVVRAAIKIDPHTAAVSVVTGPLPQMLEGVPLRLKTIEVTIDREDFILDPTNCARHTIAASVKGALPDGSPGTTASVSSSYAVTGCRSLAFSPTLTATTRGKASKLGGASFVVKLSTQPGQANIAKATFVLPLALPSRLSTLQKACPDATFEVNPAACGAGAIIGHATAITPALKTPLTGPAFLVSHGGAAFPDVEFLLQGENVTLVLDGKTNIKKGITTSTFNEVPDAPVSSFEAVLPQGPHSILTANVPVKRNYSLCGTHLVMPTTITAQNGAVTTRNTPVRVTGCARTTKLRHKHASHSTRR